MVDRGFGSNAQYLAAKRFKESLSTKFSSDVFADDVVEDEHDVLLSERIVGFLCLSFLRASSFSSSSSSTSSSSSSVVGLESSPSSSNSPPAFPSRRVNNAFLRFFETTDVLFVEP
jgi:hypothetical protein